MTADKAFKHRVRARARRTGESYTASLRHFRPEAAAAAAPEESTFRLAVAQVDAPTDPRDAASLRRVGHDIRQLMTDAGNQGARLVHFGEGALCTPDKRIMSSDPTTVAAADWTRFDWSTQRRELRQIAAHAAQLRLWTVVGAVHQLSEPHRPHNSLYVVDDHGRVVTRYDERMLSNTKVSHLYTPGTTAVTFDVEDVRFGCALGMESQYPELFAEYERAGVHGVLLSTMDNGAVFALQARAHASTNSYWVSYATRTADASAAPSGLATPDGDWADRCPAQENAALVVVDVGRDHEGRARPWRRAARSGRYVDAVVGDDPRTRRTAF